MLETTQFHTASSKGRGLECPRPCWLRMHAPSLAWGRTGTDLLRKAPLTDVLREPTEEGLVFPPGAHLRCQGGPAQEVFVLPAQLRHSCAFAAACSPGVTKAGEQKGSSSPTDSPGTFPTQGNTLVRNRAPCFSPSLRDSGLSLLSLWLRGQVESEQPPPFLPLCSSETYKLSFGTAVVWEVRFPAEPYIQAIHPKPHRQASDLPDTKRNSSNSKNKDSVPTSKSASRQDRTRICPGSSGPNFQTHL